MRRRILIQLIAAIVLTCAAAIAFSVWALAEGVVIRDAYSPPTLGSGTTGAIYMRIVNDAAAADKVIAVSTKAAERAELHLSADENGVATMKLVKCVEVPAHGEVAFAPHGLHVMLFGVRMPLKSGDRLTLRLEFEKAGVISVEIPVKGSPASMEMGDSGMSMNMTAQKSGPAGSGPCY